MRQLKITPRITEREGDVTERYFNDINQIELLTAEEEVQLARRIRKGDQVALNDLVKSNLRFVASVAKQYQHRGLPLNDLINEGNLGLIKAAMNFDETKGFKFISYAVWWIRQAILKALEEHARIVRLPSNKQETIQRINRAFLQLEQEYGRPPNIEELSEVTNASPKDIQKYLQNNGRHLSIDEPMGEDERSSSQMKDVLADKQNGNPDDGVIDESLKNELRRLLSKLHPREAKILMYSFGLDGGPSRSPSEVGQKIKLSRERVRQIKTRALQRLKKMARPEELIGHL